MLPGPYSRSTNFRRWTNLTLILIVISFRLEQQAWFRVCVVPLVPITFHFIITWLDVVTDRLHLHELSRQRWRDHRHSELIQNINWIHDEKYHPCPSMICVIIGNILAFPSTQTCSCFVLYLEILATQLMLCSTLEYCYLLCQECHGKFTTLKNSWYKWYLLTSPFFFGPCVVSNRNTDKWSVMCKF